MTLSSGTFLGPYQIVAPLGAGGMGEVYRARDSKLNREVALKVLPDAFAADAERMARFEREARVLASLNHTNIASIYGIEESSGVRALVMELAEGPTLAERIQQGPIPLEEALPIAKQIAEALEYAHEKGIIHRDLKPANVKVTPEGVVKVLDFGLAKALEDSPSAENVANSPTLSLAATKAGVILGTAAYMAPEQAAGKSTDRRADIWSFGVVLYEMLTGKRAFAGDSVSETLAAVIKCEPDWNAIPRETPATMNRLLRRCLTKDSKERLRDIGEARISIARHLADPAAGASESRGQSGTHDRRWLWGWVAAAALAIALIIASAGWWQAVPPLEAVHPQIQLTVDLGPDARLGSGMYPQVILSPDGSRLVYKGRNTDGKNLLHTRLLEQAHAVPLTGSEDASDPFFSPDGQWIGFFADSKLKKISVLGGAAIPLADVPWPRGASWGEDGQIVLGWNQSGLRQVSSTGGPVKTITELHQDEYDHRWPQILPGGQAVIFTVVNAANSFNYDEARVEIQFLKTGQRKTLQPGATYGRYVPSGHLIYLHNRTLYAAPMDAARFDLTEPAVPVLENVSVNMNFGVAKLAFSRTGTLLIQRSGSGIPKTIAWMDRSSNTKPLLGTPGNYSPGLRFSPDGKVLALVSASNGSGDVWTYDWERERPLQLTSSPGMNLQPLWTPDGKHIIFASTRVGGFYNLYWIRSDRREEPRRLIESKNDQFPTSLSPNGTKLAFVERSSETGLDIWILPLDTSDPDHPKPGKPEPFLRTPARENAAAFSPDGRWLAYQSNATGRYEVYVLSFPGKGGPWPVSTNGGQFPVWSRNGELFFQDPERRLMVSTYTAKGDAFAADKPRLWSDPKFRLLSGADRLFDLAPDGKRFAVIVQPEGTSGPMEQTQVTLIQNFFDELRRRVPAGGK